MKLQKTRLGFTLIELLVVITIIGILATGAVNVYTSQIQKARDTTRISDMKALQSGVEQFYQDGGVYPSKSATSFNGVTVYLPKMPQDPKSGQASANSVFDYMYNVSGDGNSIPEQEYEVSTHFEQGGNITGKAATDGGDDQYRLELGINNSDTEHPTAFIASPTNIAGSKFECVTPGGGTASIINCGTPANPMLIRN